MFVRYFVSTFLFFTAKLAYILGVKDQARANEKARGKGNKEQKYITKEENSRAKKR